NFAGNARGISDTRIGAGNELTVSNTTVRNMGGTGIVVLPATASVTINVTLDNVRVRNSNFGVAVGAATRLAIDRSVFSGNAQAGVEAESAAVVHLSNSMTSNNGIGVQNGGGATILINNNDIVLNNTGISGATTSFGNNRIAGNTAPGTAPSAAGGPSSNL